MPFFGFFGGNLSGLTKRGSRLAAQGSGSQARKIASPTVVSSFTSRVDYFKDVLYC